MGKLVKIRGIKSLDRQLKRLAGESEVTAKNGLARLAFEVKDQLAIHIGKSLKWSSANTQRFISQGYRVRYTTREGVFRALIYPREKTANLLIKHSRGGSYNAGTTEALQSGSKIAIPSKQNVPKGSRGRVKGSLQPFKLLNGAGGESRGFVSKSGRALMIRRRGSPTPDLGYILVPRIKIPVRIDIQRAGREAAIKRAGPAFAAAIRKSMIKAGAI